MADQHSAAQRAADEQAEDEHRSRRVVLVAIAANAGVMVAFGFAAAITGSASMVAQTVHAAADTGNQGILLVSHRHRRSGPSADTLQAGREAYFWALLAAIGLFVVGGAVSVWEGVHELRAPEPASDFGVAYVVLALALVLEGSSLLQAYRETRRGAQELDRGLLGHLVASSDPTTRAVFGEDAAAVLGNLFAITGIVLHQVTGSSVPDALASIAIGLLLGALALFLAVRNRDFLVGQSADDDAVDEVRQAILAEAGVVGCSDLLVTFVGPGQVWVVARVDVEDTLLGAGVEDLSLRIEAHLKARSEAVVRVDVVPVGAAGPAG